MREETRAPAAIFGIRIKNIIFCIIVVASIAIVFDPLNIMEFFSPRIPGTSSSLSPDDRDKEITATPEMISQAVSNILRERSIEHEATDPVSETDRFFYVVELNSGGDIEAEEISIKPDSVTITASNGIETVIPRNTIKDIKKYKLPGASPP